VRVVALTLLLLPAAVEAQTKPAFLAQSGRVVATVLPASVLSEHDVSRQLGSGLTTTFIVTARHRDSDHRGVARIEIRFDLWDEVWLVRRIEFDGKEDRQRIPSRETLETWWSTPLRIFGAATDRVLLNVTLTVLPFSVAEGEDARQWIAKSGGLTGEGGSPLVSALIGTTFNARPLRSYRWSAEVSFR